MEDLGMRRATWHGRSVLVTGCTGLLGGWLTQALVEAGAAVVGLIRDWVPQSRIVDEGVIERIRSVRGSVDDLALLERVLNEYEVETVFHLAAQTIVRIANRNPVSTFESNVRGTWTVLEAVRRTPTVRRLVVASSDKAYGEHKELPYTEETPLQGRHPYDVSKSCADLLTQAYVATYDLPACVTRMGNLFGGGDLNLSRLIPGTIWSVLRGERPLIRSDGLYSRDYIYVEDAVAAYLSLAEQMEGNPAVVGEAFNFSYERPMMGVEVVEKILMVMERPELSPVILDEVRSEILHQSLSAVKARERLGWRPRFDFDEGLRRTVVWYRQAFEKGIVL
ncbi:MAG: CDP-glucose 4,6-dehydratase, CDP-glucose 4,6-dehydratase [candidate division NC10 bacterium CSP1-5]|nr:MAG: CDP-glucose 4,6-dehydratase, CDP-glucose 4,6-dehydratase [candidate division NC10 bacterium CSP1-5]